MRGALVATLAHPEWWAMALAAFLVRGGIVVAALPIVSLPSTAGLITTFAPPLEALVLGRPSLEGVLVGTLLVGLVLAGLAAMEVVGSWLDLALVREAAADDELELGWRSVVASPWTAFSIRLVAHVPTMVALAYGSARVVAVTYDELISPGDLAIPEALRVLARAPDAALAIIAAWLLGEALGPLAARRVAIGEPLGRALGTSIRQLATARGLATVAVTTLVLVALAVPYGLAVGGTWEHLRGYLEDAVEAVPLGAALIVFVASWVLGLAVLGAALAWRATAWTVLVATGRGDGREASTSAPSSEGAAG
jgi:hypothetical protein